MGRLIRISIYALAILVLYFWIVAIIKAYSNKPNSDPSAASSDGFELAEDSMRYDNGGTYPISDGTEGNNDENLDYTDVDNKLKAYQNEEIETNSENVVADTPDNNPAPKPSSKNSSPPSSEKTKTTTKKTQPPKTETIHSAQDGKFMVMAGSYLLKENADKMVSKLKKLGYKQSRVVIFPSSQYHSVIAGQYDVQTSAQEASSDLKRKGIDSFVKSK